MLSFNEGTQGSEGRVNDVVDVTQDDLLLLK